MNRLSGPLETSIGFAQAARALVKPSSPPGDEPAQAPGSLGAPDQEGLTARVWRWLRAVTTAVVRYHHSHLPT